MTIYIKSCNRFMQYNDHTNQCDKITRIKKIYSKILKACFLNFIYIYLYIVLHILRVPLCDFSYICTTYSDYT